jgi:hypothetical protein
MASVHWGAKGGNDIETLWKFVGDLITTGITERGRNIYAVASSATEIELRAFLSLLRGRASKQTSRSAAGLAILEPGIVAVGSRTLEAAYAEDCSNYRFQTTGT